MKTFWPSNVLMGMLLLNPMLHPVLRPAAHGASGWYDDILTWGVVAIVLVMIAYYIYRTWRERAAEQESQKHDDQE
ncbi:MAG: hypothetical protein U0822_28205 [Anaerolineae bacterium]